MPRRKALRAMGKKIMLLFVFGVVVRSAFSQLNFAFQEGTFLIKGKVIDLQSKKPVPFTNIRINSTNRGITCDNEGSFTMYVSKTDTLRFSSTGYTPKSLHVSDFDSSKYYTLEIQLMHDFIKLREITIYPYRTKEEFMDAFMDAKDVNKVTIPGIAPPKYSNKIPKAKFYNPISFLYDRVKKRRAANPDFKP
jgi:hypothetical protein